MKVKVKVKHLTVLLIVAGAITIFSCNRDKLFEREQYKKVFALLRTPNLSSLTYNIFGEEHVLDSIVCQGYVSAVVGGSLLTEKDINISIIEDESLLAEYNLTTFGEEAAKYAQRLPRDMYDIASYNITIPAGERVGLMDIKVKPNGLNPDSVYYIPFRVDKYSSYELNEERGALLYRVFIKNFYSTNISEVYYNYRLKLDSMNMMGNKRVFPVRYNSVRTTAGILPYGNHLDTINNSSILITVAEDNKVKIESWKDLQVTQLDGDPDYPNTFSIVNDGYRTHKTFLLCYEYVYQGKKQHVREELMLEFKEVIDY
jgi:hypothetical protein